MNKKMREMGAILGKVKKLAISYKKLTGKPLGITGEVAEYTAASILKLKLCEARQSGYDATKRVKGKEIKIQIKGRCIPDKSPSSQRVGSIQLKKEWDRVVLVLLNQKFELLEIYQAERNEITQALTKKGSKARNVKGQLGVAKFKAIGTRVW